MITVLLVQLVDRCALVDISGKPEIISFINGALCRSETSEAQCRSSTLWENVKAIGPNVKLCKHKLFNSYPSTVDRVHIHLGLQGNRTCLKGIPTDIIDSWRTVYTLSRPTHQDPPM